MKSHIWKVTTQMIGELEEFKTEYDMEAFLMNNPQILGCWDPDIGGIPYLLRQQLSTVKKTGDRGRIDLVGLIRQEENYLLKIFELKKGQINEENVKQLISYLHGWSKETSAKEQVRRWMEELEIPQINPKNIKRILDNPKGVVIGASFTPEAVTSASKNKIEGVRLTRFISSSNECYVIIEDQIGEIVGYAERTISSWKDLMISPQDRLYIEVEGQKIWARPDKEAKNVNFEEKSRKLLLKRQSKIIGRARKIKEYDYVDDAKRALENLKNSDPIQFSPATLLAFYALGERRRKSWWTPAPYWKLERTGETILELQSKFKQGGNK